MTENERNVAFMGAGPNGQRGIYFSERPPDHGQGDPFGARLRPPEPIDVRWGKRFLKLPAKVQTRVRKYAKLAMRHASGNSSSATTTVTVPHDQGKKASSD